ncbi:ectoine/hydroxyectoine ABC transporter substrate-binding protein EhuB [Lentibacillus halophilus]|uniref:Ectoine/hydroxyectoine ABC transporter substrate-binding protein EhuB n=1 Tax=Lentibacillus halophilus TaxID=295065 RepID=A0ABP3IZG6_9BACI
MKGLKLLSIFTLVLLFLVACGSGGSEETSGKEENGESGDQSKLAELKEAGKVTIGFANEKPYGYQDDSGELKGAGVDIAEAVFADMGIDTVNGKISEFGELVAGLNAGKFDVITAGMAIKPDRCENADFGQPEMVYGEGLIVPKGNPKDLHSYTDIAETGASVSIMSGATEIGYVQKMGVKESQIKKASDIAATFAAVESGRADATTGTEMTVKMALKSAGNDNLEFVNDFKQPDIKGVPSYGAAAFHPDNDKLRKAYNESLQKLIDDGTVAEMLEKNGFDPKYNAPPEDIKTEEICSGEKW